MMEQVNFKTLTTANGKKLAIVTLNNESMLNVINLSIIRAMRAQLICWQQDDDIAMVIIMGSGKKAFCAGGDVRAIYHDFMQTSGKISPAALAFFEQEYRLDYLLYSYAKPLLVWGDGIVMGGGAGLLASASHRIVTERSIVAMPEVVIGLYPDAGGSYFLNKMVGRLGLFLGLTGFHMSGADAYYSGIANYYLNSELKQTLLEQLIQIGWGIDSDKNHQLLSAQLQKLSRDITIPNSCLAEHQQQIEQLMKGTLTQIVQSLTEIKQQAHTEDKSKENCDYDWLIPAINQMLAGSPISQKLVYAQSQLDPNMTLAQLFRFELGLCINCCVKGDFIEGVRALLIDKDRQPQWQFDELAKVSDEYIEELMHSPWQQESHPLADLELIKH